MGTAVSEQIVQFIVIRQCGRMVVYRCMLSIVLCLVYTTTCGSYGTWRASPEPVDIMVDVVNRLGLVILKVSCMHKRIKRQ